MKIQMLLDGKIVNSQIVSELLTGEKTSLAEFKRRALKVALEDRAIRISESLRVTFRLFDVRGQALEDKEDAFGSAGLSGAEKNGAERLR
ncbi:MAG: hypothetical protein ABIQ30_07550 [Devosia sp.]